MPLKKRDTEQANRYWDFVERTAQRVQERRPSWIVSENRDKSDSESRVDCGRTERELQVYCRR